MKIKKKRSLWMTLLIATPVLILTLSAVCALLISRGKLPLSPWLPACIAGVTGFVLSLWCAKKSAQKKMLWEMLTTVALGVFFLLCNLLFFGEGYGNIAPVQLTLLGSGVIGGAVGALGKKKRKYA